MRNIKKRTHKLEYFLNHVLFLGTIVYTRKITFSSLHDCYTLLLRAVSPRYCLLAVRYRPTATSHARIITYIYKQIAILSNNWATPPQYAAGYRALAMQNSSGIATDSFTIRIWVIVYIHSKCWTTVKN